MSEQKARKTAQIVTRVDELDRERLKREAERDGCDVSTWVRMALRREFATREQRKDHLVAA